MDMFFIESEDFLNNLLSFGFNTMKYFLFFTFRHQTDLIFFPYYFFGKYKVVRRRSQWRTPRGAKRGHHVAKKFVCMVGPIFAPVGQIDAKFTFIESS
jgi:hypothetical protein